MFHLFLVVLLAESFKQDLLTINIHATGSTSFGNVSIINIELMNLFYSDRIVFHVSVVT